MGSDKWTGMPNIMLWGRNREFGGGYSFFHAWKTVVQHPCGAGITTVHTGYISTGSMDFISRLSVHVLVSSCSNLEFCRKYMANVKEGHTRSLRSNRQPLMKNLISYLCRTYAIYLCQYSMRIFNFSCLEDTLECRRVPASGGCG